MTKQEAEALKTYIDFLASQTEGGNKPEPLDRDLFERLKPVTFGMDFAKIGPLVDRTAWVLYGEPSEKLKGAFSEIHSKDEAGRLISIENLLTEFLDGKGGIKNITPLFVEFAKLVRRLTIQETTDGIGARIKKPRWENDIEPVPYVERRPDEDLILIPKDFTI